MVLLFPASPSVVANVGITERILRIVEWLRVIAGTSNSLPEKTLEVLVLLVCLDNIWVLHLVKVVVQILHGVRILQLGLELSNLITVKLVNETITESDCLSSIWLPWDIGEGSKKFTFSSLDYTHGDLVIRDIHKELSWIIFTGGALVNFYFFTLLVLDRKYSDNFIDLFVIQ